MELQEVARWAYVLFVLIAVLAGFILGFSAHDSYVLTPADPPVNWAENIKTNDGYVLFGMLVLGSVIGLTSITRKEVSGFLIATIALLVASGANVWAGLWYLHPLLFFWASAILSYIVAFAAPAAVIIAIKSVLDMAKEK